MDLSTGHTSDMRTIIDNKLDTASVWTATRLAGSSFPGFADAGPQEAVALSTTTFSRTATLALPSSCVIIVAADGTHVADTLHSSLGDEADAAPGPGPPRPCNTLQTGTIDSSVTTARTQAHHNIAPLAVGNDGSVVIDDSSAAGGVAGITQSSDFGLLVVHGASPPLQLAHYDGGSWSAAAAFGSTVVAAHGATDSSGAMTLQVFTGGGSPTTIDTATDGYASLIVLS